MPLDPAAAAIVAVLDGVFPKVGTEVLDAADARRILRETPLPQADVIPVARVVDRTIPGPGGDIPIRLYWPTETTAPLPMVTFFHGGGWVLCDLDTHDATCRSMALGAEALVISVDYRLAPEHRFPAAAEDAYAAAVWAHDHARELGGDPARLAVAGDSAGGNLAAAVSLMARDRGGPPLAFQLLVYPVLDHDFGTASYRDNAEGYFLTAAHMRWYWAQYLGDPADGRHPYASPLRAGDLGGVAPAWIVTAEFDPLRDEGEAYGTRLTDAGIPVTVRRYDGMFHGFFGMAAVLDGARLATEEAFAALRSALA
ncbi:MAG: alpha/beta hydrolase [Acidimicrobiales bacterium]